MYSRLSRMEYLLSYTWHASKFVECFTGTSESIDVERLFSDSLLSEGIANTERLSTSFRLPSPRLPLPQFFRTTYEELEPVPIVVFARDLESMHWVRDCHFFNISAVLMEIRSLKKGFEFRWLDMRKVLTFFNATACERIFQRALKRCLTTKHSITHKKF